MMRDWYDAHSDYWPGNDEPLAIPTKEGNMRRYGNVNVKDAEEKDQKKGQEEMESHLERGMRSQVERGRRQQEEMQSTRMGRLRKRRSTRGACDGNNHFCHKSWHVQESEFSPAAPGPVNWSRLRASSWLPELRSPCVLSCTFCIAVTMLQSSVGAA